MNRLIVLLCTCMLPWAALADVDPLESVNRKIHSFNEVLDKNVLRPVARGYDRVLPGPAKRGVNNFFGNLGDVGDLFNNLLQGKLVSGFSDLGRIVINSSIGLGGLFDPASRMGLVDHAEDFGQTMGVWGVPRGAYVVIPMLGPSTVRDLFGRSADTRLDPLRYYYPVSHRNSLYAVDLVNTRANLLSAESVVFGDKYLFYRDAYLQRREFLEKDGKVEDPFDDDF